MHNQPSYLARVVSFDGDIVDEGILPLAHFVDEAGPDAVAVVVEMDSQATIYPAVYVRRGADFTEHALPPHVLHQYESEEYRRQLAALLT